ncbi:MAG: hypothetical protein JWR21_3337 [Herminiimonas sp.]|nr:hypothetical protein [Herminiimonas sp.]MDB5852320.1 hypothetical protein [Herminiimonas sp.]
MLPGVPPAADPAPELEPLAPASDDPDELGDVEDDEGEADEDDEGDEGEEDDEGDDGEAEGLALEPPAAPDEPAEPEDPALPPPIEEPEAPLLPLAPAGESDPDLLHPAIAIVMTLAARTMLVLSIEFIAVPFRRIVYPSIQIPLTPSDSISFTKFGVALPRKENAGVVPIPSATVVGNEGACMPSRRAIY